MTRAIPTNPYTPEVQGITWALFLVIFTTSLLAGYAQSWLKTFAYLSPKTDADGDTLKSQANGTMVSLFMLYAYAYAYVRVAFASTAIVLLVLAAKLIIPEISIDARNVFEFLHFRHWNAHIAAMFIYIFISLGQCALLFGVPANTASKANASRQFTRISIISISAIFLFYLIYAANVIQVAGRTCYIQPISS